MLGRLLGSASLRWPGRLRVGPTRLLLRPASPACRSPVRLLTIGGAATAAVAAADMPPSSSQASSQGARKGGKKAAAAPDPTQPTLQQVMARAAAAKPPVPPAVPAAPAATSSTPPSASATSASSITSAVGGSLRGAAPVVAATSTAPVVPAAMDRSRAPLISAPAPPPSPGLEGSPWTVEREVFSLRRTVPPSVAGTGTSTVANAGHSSRPGISNGSRGGIESGSAGTVGGDTSSSSSSGRSFASQSGSQVTDGGGRCSVGAAAGSSISARGTTSASVSQQGQEDSDDDVVVVTEGLGRMGLGAAAVPPPTSGGDTGGGGAAAAALGPPPPRRRAASKAAKATTEDSVQQERGPITAPAAAAGAAATPPPAKGRGRGAAAKAKGRSGNAAGKGGELLWTELSAEERAAAGGTSWVRWEPLSSAAADGDAPSPAPCTVYQLFSFDIETVDFMRNIRGSTQKRFPRPDQCRLLELAAVDLGTYDNAASAAAAAAGAAAAATSRAGARPSIAVAGAVGSAAAAEGVFATLVNCGKAFKDHKTQAHNGITYAESTAPGVPHTAAALQALFAFIRNRCDRTAAAAAAVERSRGGAASGGSGGGVSVVPLLMAHNGAMFDFPVLHTECGRVGVEWPQDWWYFDTLVMGKALWAKAHWPCKPAAACEEEDVEDEGEERNGAEAAGGKPSLSMESLKLWAGVVSDGQSHRAGVDAQDLVGVWAAMHERFGRPSPQHLERLCGATAGSKAAAGPMHRLGLVSLAARSDGLTRHMEEAVAQHLLPGGGRSAVAARGTTQQQQQQLCSQSLSQPLSQSNAATAAGYDDGDDCGANRTQQQQPSRVLTLKEVRQVAAGGELQLVPYEGNRDGGSFWGFEVKRLVRPGPAAAPQGAGGDDEDAEEEEEEGGAGSAGGPHSQSTQQQAAQQAVQVEPFVVLLRGVKLRYMADAKYAFKDDNKPKWGMTLLPSAGAAAAAGGSSNGSSGANGATSADEFADLVKFLEQLALHASTQTPAAGNVKVLPSGRPEPGKKKTPAMCLAANLHAQLSVGPARGQLRWEPLATLASYDKKTASYKPLQWPPLESYIPPAAAAAAGGGDGGMSQPILDEPVRSLQDVKEDVLARVAAQLPDFKSSDVLDVAVWPQMVWVNRAQCGVKLEVVHMVRRSGR